jgi:hypothetical protein
MMLTFLATFLVFVLVVFGMSLGWIIKRKSIQGSCGGISSLGMEKVCDCPEPCDARKKEWPANSNALFKFCRPGKAQPPPGVFHIHFSILIYLLYTYPVMSEGLLCAK